MGEFLALPKGIKKEIPKKENKKEEKKEVKKEEKKLLQKQDIATTKHIILSGESFYVIAKKYQISIDELRTANPQISNDQLKAGDELTIPSSKEVKPKEILPKQKLESKKVVVKNDSNTTTVKPVMEPIKQNQVIDR